MPDRFYFNTENDEPELDPDGTELANADQARQAAVELLSEMLRNGSGDALWRGKPLKVWVTDGPGGSGHILFTLKVSAADRR